MSTFDVAVAERQVVEPATSLGYPFIAVLGKFEQAKSQFIFGSAVLAVKPQD
jgi:hypothetical protein